MITDVIVSPRSRLVLRKSAAVSPTVVAMILIIQNERRTSGTLFQRFARGGESVVIKKKCRNILVPILECNAFESIL